MSKITDTIREFAGENRELLIALSLNALVKAITKALPLAAREVRDALEVASGAAAVLLEGKEIPDEEFAKLRKEADDAVAHIIALAHAK